MNGVGEYGRPGASNDFRNFMTLGFFLLEIPVRVQNYLKMKVRNV